MSAWRRRYAVRLRFTSCCAGSDGPGSGPVQRCAAIYGGQDGVALRPAGMPHRLASRRSHFARTSCLRVSAGVVTRPALLSTFFNPRRVPPHARGQSRRASASHTPSVEPRIWRLAAQRPSANQYILRRRSRHLNGIIPAGLGTVRLPPSLWPRPRPRRYPGPSDRSSSPSRPASGAEILVM